MQALEYFWHPVCTRAELDAARPHPLAVRLLGRSLAVADVGDHVMAVIDRCPHRSTRLSIGWIEPGSVRCAYHGWRYAADGQCVEIPSTPEGPLPVQQCVQPFDAAYAYDLVWVRLDDQAATTIPAHPAWNDSSMHVVAGAPYTWPTSALRRVENFVDLAHFAWVHDGTLGTRAEPVPPIPLIERAGGELRFHYDPPEMAVEREALFGHSRYRMPMPCTVDIEFHLDTGAKRHLWMTASPLDERSSRSFWSIARDDDVDGDDEPHIAFQRIVLDEDEPVVCNQDPPEMVLDPGFELSVRTDRVSIEYRRWLRELSEAADENAEAIRRVLAAPSVTTSAQGV